MGPDAVQSLDGDDPAGHRQRQVAGRVAQGRGRRFGQGPAQGGAHRHLEQVDAVGELQDVHDEVTGRADGGFQDCRPAGRQAEFHMGQAGPHAEGRDHPAAQGVRGCPQRRVDVRGAAVRELDEVGRAAGLLPGDGRDQGLPSTTRESQLYSGPPTDRSISSLPSSARRCTSASKAALRGLLDAVAA